MSRKIGKIFTVIASLASCGAPASTFFDNRASFEAGAADRNAITIPNTGGQGGSGSVDILTFTLLDGSSESGPNGIVFGTAGINASFSDGWSSLIEGNDLAIGGPESFLISSSVGLLALSFEIHEPTQNLRTTDGCFAPCFDTQFLIEIISNGLAIASTTLLPNDDALTFFGYQTQNSFDAVRITDVTGTVDDEWFGSFEVVVVPLPSTLTLLWVSFASLFTFSLQRVVGRLASGR